MIVREEMFQPILEVSDAFRPIWNEFIEEWKDDDELPQYLALGDLARYISSLISESNIEEVKRIFAVIERWHLEGDSYVKEAATVGILEDLQYINVVGEGVPEKIELYLLPESKKWWLKVYEFWEESKIISE
ncbi:MULTISPECIES: DUF7674 family protein [unclassified Agarivorans]|uniref:DUF7674 family protein n=1 Tax=unclassified Agarivorans TaxID=2636026 RepID=UPI0026E32C33|nr:MULTISPECIES: hypothetical protein [unclassified Agarivorans]MDO6687236.1 hypothetical protein [Agarivorans sp. 3_MG-2023]MDO6716837.1 hypothetical protein [Agarivorans sp. 2_MG-2023]